VLDPDGVIRTKTLATERIARKLRDALPGGDQPLRAALWTFLRPILSPRLTAPQPRRLYRDGSFAKRGPTQGSSPPSTSPRTAPMPTSTTSPSPRRGVIDTEVGLDIGPPQDGAS
jgi:hypothetical protein